MRRPAFKSPRRIAASLACAACIFATSTLASRASAQNNFEMTEEQFNAWLTNDGTTPEQNFESQLNIRLTRLDATCKLTTLQRQKLELAARGDIARFKNQLQPIHDELVGKFFDPNNLDPVLQQIQPLGQRLRKGILDEGSLFEKVVAATLDEDQLRALEQARAEQIGFQYRAKLKLFVATLDKFAPMLASQRDDLLAHLLKSTRPPKRWSGQQYDWYYVMNQAAQASRKEIGEILDDPQLRCFEDAVRNAAQYGRMLEHEGLTPADEPVPQLDEPASDEAAADDAASRAHEVAARVDEAAAGGEGLLFVPIGPVQAVPVDRPVLAPIPFPANAR